MYKLGNDTETTSGEPTLSSQDFDTFCDFFYRHTGIMYESSKRYFVDKRIVARIVATRCSSLREYLTMVRLHPERGEVQSLINVLTINETYFFRDISQIECLSEFIIPEIVTAKKKKTLKIWSSPCSTGEEPYSIALHLLLHWPDVDDYEIEIFGTDIDTSVLEQAKRGIYSERSVQGLPKNVIDTYFTKLPGRSFQICAELRDSVSFDQLNIIDTKQTRGFRDFDIIFSRNMLIYFDEKSRKIAAEAFYDALAPGGFLCLAPAESMSRISSLFKLRTFPGVTAYQKPK
jgi:chemotaxis protein methyltransferase CheR